MAPGGVGLIAAALAEQVPHILGNETGTQGNETGTQLVMMKPARS
jgi:hypothetical protein